MRVLQLCHRVPYPPTDGGSIAMHQITEGLINEGIHVKVLALSPLPLENNQGAIPEEYRLKTGFEAVTIDTRIKLIPAFLNLFTARSYNVERYRSKHVSIALERILTDDKYDIIQLEGLYLTPYIALIRSLSKAAMLYRSHNIEHFIWQRLAQTTRHPLRRAYLRLLAGRLQEFETRVIHEVDGLLAISEVDRMFFHDHGYHGPSVVIPAGMPEIMLPDPEPELDPDSVFHLGSMDWRPNQEGIVWFLKKVWPLVTAQNSRLTLYIAGRRMPPYFTQFESERVKIVGEVDDAIKFLFSKNIMVVPLLSGGGMRVKIIEGMAAGKPIISTNIGAEGIGCTHKTNILLADDPAEMAGWIVKCHSDSLLTNRISQQARTFAQSHYDIKNIIKNLVQFYHGFFKE